MNEVIRLQSNKIFPVISEMLELGLRVRITVTGMSMYPFLRENIDSVELVQTSWENIKRGDIVLIQRNNGMYILHRVVRKEKECFFINGDAQQWMEGPLRPNQLIAKVETVWRNNKSIKCTNIMLKILIIVWRIILPFRYQIIKIHSYLHRILINNDRKNNQIRDERQ